MSLDDILDTLPPEMIKHLTSLKPRGKGKTEDDFLTNDEDER